MKVSLQALQQRQPLEKVVVHSLDCSLYQVSVIDDGAELFVTDSGGRLLRTRSLLDMQAHFRELNVQSMVLRQVSAYDEMIGQPLRSEGNQLEVPLTTEQTLI